ncbi:MAG TPA: sigma-70 family RNA polymerase sigma factor [Gemmataceae bacterium]|jgi:RNA polymerase sigma-70 factor (ECF subfamily)|nr:sigma-70 family RNA polymerase sigma factor [Gemmataceae bacterium]
MKMPPPTDAELLDRFLRARDEAAFAELVRRLGPMVRATCRRSLGDSPDADDAFQASFLVLARKAGAVRDAALLGPWLHTVAVRTARRAKALAARRQAHERLVTTMPDLPAELPAAANEWLPLLDEELQRLPEKYRAPIVLCELLGASRADAARRLGVPEGTLSSRLARGRDLLRRRLVRRGAIVTGVAIAAAFTAGAQAAVPPNLISSITAALHTGAASASVSALSEGVLRAMLYSKLKVLLIVMLTLGIVCGAGAGLSYVVHAQEKDKEKDPAKSDQERLEGTWEVTSAQMSGKEAEGQEAANIKEHKIVFKGDTLTAKEKCKFKLDPTKNPKELDLEVDVGNEVEKGTWKGIYELKGDDLTLCMALPNMDRPGTFESKEGIAMLKLKRVK